MNHFKKLNCIFLLLSVCSLMPTHLRAQQDAQFSQNMFNKLTYNPGFAGMNHAQCGSLFYRNQWVGFGGAPITSLVNLNMFAPKFKGGFGLTAMQDRLGNDRTFATGVSVSHHFNLFKGELSLGGKVGLIQKSFINNWIAPDGNTNDNSIPSNSNAMSYLDLSAGAFYLDASENYVGLSVTNAYSVGNANAAFKNVPHYYVTMGTRIDLPFMRSVVLKPSVVAKSDVSSTIFDINALAFINYRFWVGTSYRMTDAIVIMGGVIFGPLKIGYSYDLTTSALKNHSSNTHEFMISYCRPLRCRVRASSHINPRYMQLKPHPHMECVDTKCRLYNTTGGNMTQ